MVDWLDNNVNQNAFLSFFDQSNVWCQLSNRRKPQSALLAFESSRLSINGKKAKNSNGKSPKKSQEIPTTKRTQFKQMNQHDTQSLLFDDFLLHLIVDINQRRITRQLSTNWFFCSLSLSWRAIGTRNCSFHMKLNEGKQNELNEGKRNN